MLFQSKRRALGHASLTAGLAAAALALLAPVTAHAAPPDDVGPNAVPAAASAQTAIPLPSAIPFARPAAAGQPALRTGPVAAPPTNPAVVTVPDGATAPSLATDALVQITLIQGGSSAAQTSYNVLRAQLATIVGFQLGRDPAAFEAAWSAADLTHQTALMAAFSQIGTPYHSGQSNPGKGFDCSGLTSFAWGVAGVGIPRSSGTQISAASSRTAETAMAGDLLQYPGHVMMYLGVPGTMVHSPYTGRRVEVDNIPHRSVRYGNPIG